MDGASHFQVSALAKGTALWCSAAYFNVPAIAWSGRRGCSPPLKGNGGVPQLVSCVMPPPPHRLFCSRNPGRLGLVIGEPGSSLQSLLVRVENQLPFVVLLAGAD
jgi:hypothetical protein